MVAPARMVKKKVGKSKTDTGTSADVGSTSAPAQKDPFQQAGKKSKKRTGSKGAPGTVQPSAVESPKQAAPSSKKSESAPGKTYEGLPRKWRSKNSAEDWRRKELEKRNCTKYHFLKFMEKQKVERKLRSVRKQMVAAMEAGNTNLHTTLREQLKSHLADYEYIEHYPKHLPYNALFPKEDSEPSRRRREEIRKLIRAEREKEEKAVDRGEGDDVDDDDDFFEQKRNELRSGRSEQSGTPKLATPTAGRNGKTKQKKAESVDQEQGTKRKKAGTAPVADKGAKDGKARKQNKFAPPGDVDAAGARGNKKHKTGVVDQEDEENLHPSWQARKSAKLSGALVQDAESGAGRTVFESDSE